jgi:hypothetical protein
LQQLRWVAVATEDYATMALASGLSKPRAYYYNDGISVSKDGKKGCVQCKGQTWQQWQGDRQIAAAVVVGVVQIR